MEENGEKEREVGRENIEEKGDLHKSANWEGKPNVLWGSVQRN